MKKKNLFVSLGLVATLGVGATLAYLSDSAGELTNTFTFTQNGIDITLEEHQVELKDGNYVETENETDKGNTYAELLPNMMLDKDPHVTVKADSVNCYVVVSVKNANDKLKITDINETDYKLIETDGDTKYYQYNNIVTTSDKDQTLVDIFQHVQVASDANKDTDFTDIVIKAAAVQADNNDKAIQQAVDMLKNAQ